MLPDAESPCARAAGSQSEQRTVRMGAIDGSGGCSAFAASVLGVSTGRRGAADSSRGHPAPVYGSNAWGFLILPGHLCQ